MTRRYYTIECDRCYQESTIVVDNSEDEPSFCPMCGDESYGILEDEEDE